MVIIVKRFGSLMNQLVIHIDIRIKENSLIGISAIHVRNEFLLTCPINFRSHIVINGFAMITRNNHVLINHRFMLQLNERFDHNNTK